MDRVKKITLTANLDKPNIPQWAERITSILSENDVEVSYEKELAELLGKEGAPLPEASRDSQMVIILGGDGTMLAVAREMVEREIPLLGINLGRLGFLTQLVPDNIETHLSTILKGDYSVNKRIMLQGDFQNEKENIHALNEICIERGESPRLLEIKVFISDKFVSNYHADGILISTPTGSTAYSMAAGGAIANPYMEAILITPLSPYSLSIRPMVVGSDETIQVQIHSPGSAKARIVADGQEQYTFKDSRKVSVTKSNYYSYFVDLETRSFYDVLRTKLGWGSPPGITERGDQNESK